MLKLQRFLGRRKQNSALADWQQILRDEEARIADTFPNPLQRARSALEAGDIESAIRNWEEAKVLMPNLITRSEEAFQIVLDLGRFEEAELLLGKMRKHYLLGPGYTEFYLPSLALILERRGDLTAAVRAWKKLRRLTPHSIVPYIREATCLCGLDKLHDAEVLFDYVLAKQPNDFFVRLAAARLSDRQRKWSKSLIHWRILAAPLGHIPSIIGYAKVQLKFHPVGEVESYLDHALTIYPTNQELITFREELAKRRNITA